MRVFLTGATGFIGSHLIDRLVEDCYNLTALIRETSDLTFLPIDKITLHKGDLRDKNSLIDAMSDCNVVIHAGAMTSDWGDKKEFYDINVNGTKNVLEAAKSNGINQILFISSTEYLVKKILLR